MSVDNDENRVVLSDDGGGTVGSLRSDCITLSSKKISSSDPSAFKRIVSGSTSLSSCRIGQITVGTTSSSGGVLGAADDVDDVET